MVATSAVHAIKTAAELGFAEVYASAHAGLPGGKQAKAARASAFDSFLTNGLPTARTEAWKYTDLRRLIRDAKPLAPPPGAAERARARSAGALFAALTVRRLLVIDGVFVPELSDLENLEPGLGIRSSGTALQGDEPILGHGLGAIVPRDETALALNTALAADGVAITIAPGAALARPIHLVFVATSAKPEAIYTRSLVVVGRGARATLLETHEGPARPDYQVNTALQLVVGEDADVEHVKVIREGRHALHLGTLLANLGARARFSQFNFVTGGAVVRNQIFAHISGAAAVAGLRGVCLIADHSHVDTTLAIDHAEPGGESRELFKSVLDGEARSVFQGKIAVRRKAQKTDAKMMARALLLSEKAEADCKPELEIFADDVQCGHGSTTGTLDDQLKFYLMARGIPPKEAESLLIQAFAGEAIDFIQHEGVRETLMSATQDWLSGRA
jgi:Fe-S cluster assembly protein SufD